MTHFDVVGLGASAVDTLALVDHFPSQEEVQRAVEITVQGGGPVSTAMVTLARLGANVAMLDQIGDDRRGALIREEFQREGVNVDHVRVSPGHTSPTASIFVRQSDGARTIAFVPGSAPELAPGDLPRDAITSARFLHVNGRHWDACLQACRWAQEAGVRVSFDGGADRYRPSMRQLVPLTDVCVVARDFAERYTGRLKVQKAAEILLKEGPGVVGITDGTQGSWVLSEDEGFFHQPAYLVPNVVDTTGCGDSYHGAFVFGLLRGLSLEETASWASAVAALNTQQLGGRQALPTLEEVKAFLDVENGSQHL